MENGIGSGIGIGGITQSGIEIGIGGWKMESVAESVAVESPKVESELESVVGNWNRLWNRFLKNGIGGGIDSFKMVLCSSRGQLQPFWKEYAGIMPS